MKTCIVIFVLRKSLHRHRPVHREQSLQILQHRDRNCSHVATISFGTQGSCYTPWETKSLLSASVVAGVSYRARLSGYKDNNPGGVWSASARTQQEWYKNTVTVTKAHADTLKPTHRHMRTHTQGTMLTSVGTCTPDDNNAGGCVVCPAGEVIEESRTLVTGVAVSTGWCAGAASGGDCLCSATATRQHEWYCLKHVFCHL